VGRGGPAGGLMEAMLGPPPRAAPDDTTVSGPGTDSLANSPPVTTVTLWRPRVASGPTVTLAVRDVGLATVTLLMVMFASLKSTVDDPLAKVGDAPVVVTSTAESCATVEAWRLGMV